MRGNKAIGWMLTGALVASIALVGCGQQEGTATDDTKDTSTVIETVADEVDEAIATTDKEGGIDYLVLVNNEHKLPDDWEATVDLIEAPNPMGEQGSGPIPVERKAYEAFLELQKDVLENDGVDIELDSAYRSVEKQQKVWDEFLEEKGEEYTKSHVAVPGYSEHHTGLAIDLYLVIDGKDVYENDEMMKHQDLWDKVHAKLADYGFILHYAEDKVDITGYDYEPWHIRYVGSPEVAHEMADANLTLEEYLLDGKATDTKDVEKADEADDAKGAEELPAGATLEK